MKIIEPRNGKIRMTIVHANFWLELSLHFISFFIEGISAAKRAIVEVRTIIKTIIVIMLICHVDLKFIVKIDRII